MFRNIVLPRFLFLVKDYHFNIDGEAPDSVSFSKGGVFVTIYYSILEEVSLRTGLISEGFDRGFSIGPVVALTDPKLGFGIRVQTATRPEGIDRAVATLADMFRTYGQRICEGDESVFTELDALMKQRRKDDNCINIRSRAEEAFAAKNYREAIRQYQQLGDQARPLDVKRLEMSIKRLGPNE